MNQTRCMKSAYPTIHPDTIKSSSSSKWLPVETRFVFFKSTGFISSTFPINSTRLSTKPTGHHHYTNKIPILPGHCTTPPQTNTHTHTHKNDCQANREGGRFNKFPFLFGSVNDGHMHTCVITDLTYFLSRALAFAGSVLGRDFGNLT